VAPKHLKRQAIILAITPKKPGQIYLGRNKSVPVFSCF
jgi:hypothetical protein